MAAAFSAFCHGIADSVMFRTARSDESHHARRYLGGLVSCAPRKNMERMNERLHPGEHDYEGMQHFLSGSPWSQRAVWDFTASKANERLGGHPQSLLLIDESALSKKGQASAGVARQHNGRLGKQDNCQVGVFSALNCGVHSALVGARLFLPDEWVEDPARCKKAGVPEAEIKPRTKIHLARELVEQALAQKLQFACVCVDAFYGRDSTFLEWLDEKGLAYCADTPANTLVFAKKPPGTQRPAKMKEAACRADAAAAKIVKRGGGEKVVLREGENGLVTAEIWCRRVWVWPADRDKARQCWLLVRRSADGSVKTSLSNAPADTTPERLASFQGGRFFVERVFEDAKTSAGMAQYQARGWRAWHHHMAMVGLAVLFMMEQRLLLARSAPLLSAPDIIQLLDWHLCRMRTEAEVIARIQRRHRQRERNATNAQNRSRKRTGMPKIRKMINPKLPK